MCRVRDGFHGIMTTPPVAAKLRQETRLELLNIIGRQESEAHDFLRGFACLVGDYRALKNLENQKPKKAHIKDGIEQLIEDVNNLSHHLLLSDQATGGILGNVIASEGKVPRSFNKDLRNNLAMLRTCLNIAMRRANDLPDKLREREPSASRWLAIELAQLFNRCLGEQPTSTKDGAFFSSLALALNEAFLNNPDEKDIDRLVRYAVREVNG